MRPPGGRHFSKVRFWYGLAFIDPNAAFDPEPEHHSSLGDKDKPRMVFWFWLVKNVLDLRYKVVEILKVNV